MLLSVPGFKIQAATLEHRFDIVCLPLTVGRSGLLAGIGEALRGGTGPITVEEVASGAHGTLSHREQEVLRELAQGKSNRLFAEAMWLSEDTIKSHLRRVYRKLGVCSRSEAIALYIGQLGSQTSGRRELARRELGVELVRPSAPRGCRRPAAPLLQHHDPLGGADGGEPCATTSTVVRPAMSSTTSRSAPSLAASSCEVASSRSISRGWRSSARAMATRWRSPPDSDRPRCATRCRGPAEALE